MKYVSLINSEPFWNCTTWRFIRRYRCLIISDWKTMVKRRKDQQLRLRNFDAQHGGIENRSSGQESKRDWVALKEEKVFDTRGQRKDSVSRADECSFRHESNDRAKPTAKAEPPSEPPSPRGRSVSRKRNCRGGNQSEKFNQLPCEYFLKCWCTKSPCVYWHLLECQFYRSKSGCKFGAECSFSHWKVEEQPIKKAEEGKSAVAVVISVRQLIWVSQDTGPPDSFTTYRKGKRVLEPIRRVTNHKGWLHCVKQTSEKEKVPSLGQIQVTFPHERSPFALKIDDRSLGGTARQERCARGDAWELAKKFLKLKKRHSYILFTFWGVDFACRIHNKPRGKRVCGRFWSKHAHGQQDLNKAEFETMRISKNPIMVETANVEVQTEEEATVYVRELDLFVKVMLLENTPAVLSLRKLCEEFGYSDHWTSGQKLHLINNGKKFHCDTSNHVPFVVPGLSTSSSTSSTSPTSTTQETVTDTEIPGNWKKWEYEWGSTLRLQLHKHRETWCTDACIVEADKSMRVRMEGSQSKIHEDHLAGRGLTSLSRFYLVHMFILVPEAMEIPDAKAAVEKEWKN